MDKKPESIISNHPGDRATKISRHQCVQQGKIGSLFQLRITAICNDILPNGDVRNELILEPNQRE